MNTTEDKTRFLTPNMFISLVFLSLIARAIIIYTVPPLLDVFYYDTQAISAFLHAVNPYGHTYINIPDWLSTPGAQNVYTYLPGVLLFLTPFGLIGDVRLGLVTADMIIGWGIFVMMGRHSKNASILYLLAPFSILFSTVYPNNSLVAMCFLAIALVFERVGREIMSAVFFGLSLASSQFLFLLYPFFLLNKAKRHKFKWIVVSAVSFLFVVLPFLIWDPNNFIFDVLIFQFSRSVRPIVVPARIGYNFNPSLSGFVYTFLGITVPSYVRIVIVVLLFFFFARRASDMKSTLLNCSYFLVVSMFILPNDFSWWFLELPFQTILTAISLEV